MVVEQVGKWGIFISFFERNEDHKRHIHPRNHDGSKEQEGDEILGRHVVFECSIRNAISKDLLNGTRPNRAREFSVVGQQLEY